MADRIVQLVDKNDDNIYPVTTADAPTITVTSTDPGAGSVLAANHFIAVTGSTSSLVGAADLASNAVTTTKIADNAVTANKIDLSTLGYASGDTEFIGADVINNGAEPVLYGFNAGGLLTNSAKNIAFSVVLPKSLQNISSVTISNSKVWIRHTGGGYLLNGQALTAGGTVSVGIAGDNIVSIMVVKSSAWSSTTNNTPLVVSGAIQFTFN